MRRSTPRKRKPRYEVRLVRSPDILMCWDDEGVLIQDLATGIEVTASRDVISVLDIFGRPRDIGSVASRLPDLAPSDVLRTVKKLQKLELLLPEEEGRRRVSRLKAWKTNLASAHYHVASRDMRYEQNPNAVWKHLRTDVAAHRRPRRFKRYSAATRRSLRMQDSRASPRFADVLARRRTVRRFSPAPVRFQDFATVVSGTWGRTGWIETEVLGRLATKTSPSAGALHPIECYVMAWNVTDLAAGLYHYDVGANELRRLRSGNLRKSAVLAASGQSWIGGAAFLCVLTAVFSRSLWKYQLENAYRDVWLDAGHLAQTFCLLAVAKGLGPFTTVAIQDTYIEELIGLDGIKEFPVYLCGAGVPAAPLRPGSR